jgi:hypothetical protein
VYEVSLFSRIPIVADDTVSGRANFRFAGVTFERAFDAFLQQARLYVNKEAELWTVSRVKIQRLSGSASFSGGMIQAVAVDAFDVTPARLLEKITLECGVQLSWQVLPTGAMSVHTGFLPMSAAISAVVRQFPGFGVQEVDSRFVIEQTKEVFSPLPAAAQGIIKIDVVEYDDGFADFSVDITKARFFDVVEKLFAAGETKFCFVSETEGGIARAFFSGTNFDETVRLLGSQAGMEAVVENGIYFFVPIRDKAALMSNAGKVWRRYETIYIAPETLMPLLSARFSHLETIALPRSILCLTGDTEHSAVEEFIAAADTPAMQTLVTLRYVTVDFLLHNLPPGIDARLIAKTGSAGSFFFTGSAELCTVFLDALKEIDKPLPQIRYDLLIVQFQETKDSTWKTSLSASSVNLGDKNNIAAQLGSVLNLNLDVISVFGVTFAASLQAALSENMASVFADTTLHGISGETISFKNTKTYRYRDVAIDPETGKPLYTGVTREIIAGLTLDVTGSVSGDGMITSKVTAQVSRRGADVTSTTGNPPPTSEKSITTEVRSRSGEPVVLSGLVQDDSAIVTERLPFISRIPILGKLFTAQTKTREKSEMIIYLVPHIARENNDAKYVSDEERCMRIYEDYIAGGSL